MDPRHSNRPVLDMTPEGEFRDPAPRRGTWLDRLLVRLGGAAALVAICAAGIVVAGVALAFFALAIPVAIAAGLVAFGSLWWRARRSGGLRGFATMTRR
ncbi:hypothetical protein BKE38_04385 [Pseudoroseomonas deserti]|uniref:Uncharacterized protein n=1 Tax=Teichococcus deserti TaxID=1817963 RepID=A0A1V2H6A8_9PROT|nr:hypothetical protein [Pseudoroseomonas deserti]ONG57291.1 hypothetical protein BKE38_04385 [Pseudoroseomonas deserti]